MLTGRRVALTGLSEGPQRVKGCPCDHVGGTSGVLQIVAKLSRRQLGRLGPQGDELVCRRVVVVLPAGRVTASSEETEMSVLDDYLVDPKLGFTPQSVATQKPLRHDAVQVVLAETTLVKKV